MRKLSLSDCCEIIQGGRHGRTGKDFVEGGFPAYGAGGLNGRLSDFEFDREAVILSAIGARCGKCFYVAGKWCSLANTQLILPDPQLADAKFLWFQLNNENRWPRSGTGQPFIKPSDVKQHAVYLPPLDEQRRIAAILDQADDLRRKRRIAIEKLNTLPRAIFEEMFGDPVANPKEWPVKRLGDVAERVTVGHVGTTAEFFRDDGIPFLRTGNVGEREIDLSDLKYITEAFHKTLTKSTVQSGDVLVSRVISDRIRCAIVSYELDGANCANVIIIRPGKDISSDYIAELIRQKESQAGLLGRQVGSAQTVINTGVFKQWMIPVPTREVQRAYSEKMSECGVLLSSQRASLTKLDQLFGSLQDRAFSGRMRPSDSASALAV